MPWTQEGFTVDEDGHWIPIGYDDPHDSEDDESDGPEGYGAYAAGGGECMHTMRGCAGLRNARFSSWAVFCDGLQNAARAGAIAEARNFVGPCAQSFA